MPETDESTRSPQIKELIDYLINGIKQDDKSFTDLLRDALDSVQPAGKKASEDVLLGDLKEFQGVINPKFLDGFNLMARWKELNITLTKSEKEKLLNRSKKTHRKLIASLCNDNSLPEKIRNRLKECETDEL